MNHFVTWRACCGRKEKVACSARLQGKCRISSLWVMANMVRVHFRVLIAPSHNNRVAFYQCFLISVMRQ